MKFKGEVFEGTREPLISKKLFDNVQEVMAKRGKKKYVRKHYFTFLGLLKCASCGCAVVAEIETKLEKLLDAYFNEVISADDYKTRKEKLLAKKVGFGEKIRDFEQKGLSWLELAREFVLSLNQALN
jgi:hypothetical protein